MGKITFILGGARSGKSSFAIRMAKESGKRAAFLATCQGLDSEMKKRIGRHKKARPSHWQTFEEPYNPELLLTQIGKKFDILIIDCLTLLVSNLLLKGAKEESIERKINKMLRILKKIKAHCLIVSNEVGLGIVPENKLSRSFRDIAGRANQVVAAKSDEVYFLVSGLSWRIK